jgi:single-stranded-DNA-specific exonuclease
MEYTLIGKNNYAFNPIEQILKNRGIEDVESFLSPSESNVIHHSKLKNIYEGVEMLLNHIEKGSKIFVQVDSDMDGIASSSILINYLKKTIPKVKIQWRIHEGKQHGVIVDTVPDDVNLVIIPDAGSSQYKEHAKLKERGMDVLVLDHHESDKESEHAIVVNNQLSPNYENKTLTGAAIVYKFVKALDEKLNLNYADNYLDLVALGLIGDVADLRNLETRYLMLKGLSNIKNPLLKALYEKQEYSTKGKINANTTGFYISPLMNANIRAGNMQEKLQMMNALLESKELIYYKRNDEHEPIAKSTARLLGNVKARQKRIVDKGVEAIEQRITEKNLLDNKILIVNVTDILDKNLTGLVANNLVRRYKRGTLLIRYNEKDNVFNGSMRGYDKGGIKDFRQFLLDTEQFDFVEGHANAAGLGIKTENLVAVNEIINEQLKDVQIDLAEYDVDFIVPGDKLTSKFINEINDLSDIWSNRVEEPVIAFTNVKINTDEIEILGKDKTTLKFVYKGIEFIKFKSSEEVHTEIVSSGENVTFDVIGKCGANIYQGNVAPQIIMEDFEVVKVGKKEFVF